MVPVTGKHAEIAPPPPGLQPVLDALGINPAYLVDHRFNMLAWNESSRRVFGDFSLLPERERNRVWDLFVRPSSRQLFVDWEQVTQHSVMNFRAAYDQYIGDAWFERFLTDLQEQSPEFRALWSQHDVQGVCDFYQKKELNHPQVGPLSLSSTVLIVPVDPPLHMVTFTPCSQETRIKLETLNTMECLYPLIL
jgi:hypothetical protein